MLLVGGIAWIGGGIRGDGGDRRERASLDRSLLSSRGNRRHAGHGQGVPAPGLNRVNIIQWIKRVSKSQAGFLAEFRTVKCKQRRVRSAVGHPGIHVGISVLGGQKEIIKVWDDEN